MIRTGFVGIHDDLEPLLVDIDSVQQYPQNPRAGDIDLIVESIRANGIYRPIYVQKSTGYILGGNHTWMAAKSLDAERIPVVELDVDDSAAKRIVLVDNKSADAGEYETARLVDLLESLAADAGGDLEAIRGTGYDERELKQLQELNDLNNDTDLDFAQWPTMHIQVHPDVKAKFYKVTSQIDSLEAEGDSQRFALLVKMAEGFLDD